MKKTRSDKIEYLDGAIIQHGTVNRRIYLMSIGDADPEILVPRLIVLANKRSYSKIFAKIPFSKTLPFVSAGFQVEAEVPAFYQGNEAAEFMGYYSENQRQQEPDSEELDNIVRLSKWRGKREQNKPLPREFKIRRCDPDDIQKMIKIYRLVFPTYPFPIHDPEYLHYTMKNNVDYYGLIISGQFLALASAEKDQKSKTVEMTDFATHPEWLGLNFSNHLLKRMEQTVNTEGFQTAYTIARAKSPGMNIVFAKNDYIYAGRLINNTNISGQIESMNVWYKTLKERSSSPPESSLFPKFCGILKKSSSKR